MSSLLRLGAARGLIALLAATAGLASADDVPPAVAPDQATGAAKPESTPAAATPTPSAAATPAPGGAAPLYRVVDGNHVDSGTMQGWRTWRALACERCHGANQEGLVGPSLVDGLKTMSREDFNKCVLDGRIDKGMPNFGGIKSLVDNLDNLYAFLKGRSDGAIPPGHLKEIQP